MSQGCLRASEEVKGSMDDSADPCNDFYTFACGGFNSKAVIPDHKSNNSTFTVIDDKIKEQVRINYQNFEEIYVRKMHFRKKVKDIFSSK